MITEEQRQRRNQGIGGSDCASALGIKGAYSTPYELWLEKTGRLVKPRQAYLETRELLEDDVATLYARKTGAKLRCCNRTLVHRQYPWMLVHIDRLIVGEKKFLECKTAEAYMAQEWGKNGEFKFPTAYYFQVQHGLAILGYEVADLAVLIGMNDDLRVYTIKRDDDVINAIIKGLKHFWEYHVLQDIPPEPTCQDDVIKRWPTDNGNYIEADSDLVTLVTDYKKHKQKEKELREKICLTIGEASGIRYEDKILVNWKARKDGKRCLKIG